MSWKKVDVVRPQPGHADTWGVKLRRPSDWRICCATCTSSVRSPPGRGVSETRIVSPMPSCSRIDRPAALAMMPFAPIPASVSPRCNGYSASWASRRYTSTRSCTPDTLADRVMRSCRDPHQLAAGGMQGPHLCRRGCDVGGIGVGHRLDDDRMGGAHLHAADVDGYGPATRVVGHGENITGRTTARSQAPLRDK